MRNIVKFTRAYEAWMQQRADVSKRLLKSKHRKMGAGAFPFLRATFYRWVEQWPEVCPALAARDQDVLLVVGDLRVENFGVWQDSRTRLVWGVNDFDDACELPFTSDLVRLATSVPGLLSTRLDAAVSRAEVAGGLGSLGRRRFTAVQDLGKGARDAREAKALVPSARYWHAGLKHMPSQTATLLQHVIRVPDPHFQVHDKWLVRQLAPDIAKIDMPENSRDRRLALAPALLRMMGHETANIHLGSCSRNTLETLLNKLDRTGAWFAAATEGMAACTRADHEAWANTHNPSHEVGHVARRHPAG